jgi:formyl-CoA transferase
MRLTVFSVRFYERERTGRGHRIETNMLESAVAFIPDIFSNFTRLKIDNQPRTRVASSQSYAFRCSDGKLLVLHLSSPQKFWESLVEVLERLDLQEDVRFSTRDARVRNYALLEKELAAIFARENRLHWMTRLERADVPFAPVQTIAEVLAAKETRTWQLSRMELFPQKAAVQAHRQGR